MSYKWESKDDLIALLLFKINAPNEMVNKAALKIGCPSESLKKRIQNFEFLRFGTGKMSNSSKQTETVYEEFKKFL